MSAPTPTNYSIYSIVGAYGIGLIPHGYYFVKMMANAKGAATNILYDDPLSLTLHSDQRQGKLTTPRPRENLTTLKEKVSDKVWTQLAKARGAHLNAMENLPLFAVAMVSRLA
jgi:hypothetical protein